MEIKRIGREGGRNLLLRKMGHGAKRAEEKADVKTP